MRRFIAVAVVLSAWAMPAQAQWLGQTAPGPRNGGPGRVRAPRDGDMLGQTAPGPRNGGPGRATVRNNGFDYQQGNTRAGGSYQGQRVNGQYNDGRNQGSGFIQHGQNAAMGGSYRGQDGTSGSGYVDRNSARGTYQGRDGSSGFGHVDRNSAGGGYRTQNGTSGSGYVDRNSGRMDYNSPTDGSFGGQYRTGPGGTSASGYRYDARGDGYNGGFANQGNRTQVQGEVRRPGQIPGTQDRIGGTGTYEGRNSSAAGHYNVHTRDGQQLGGMNGTLDRRQYTQSRQGGYGGVSGGDNASLRFQGVNSEVGYGQNANVRGVGGYDYGGTMSTRGASGRGSIGVGGVRASGTATVDRNGVRVNVTPPANVQMPQMPPVQVSQIPVQVPQVPQFEVPSFPSFP